MGSTDGPSPVPTAGWAVATRRRSGRGVGGSSARRRGAEGPSQPGPRGAVVPWHRGAVVPKARRNRSRFQRDISQAMSLRMRQNPVMRCVRENWRAGPNSQTGTFRDRELPTGQTTQNQSHSCGHHLRRVAFMRTSLATVPPHVVPSPKWPPLNSQRPSQESGRSPCEQGLRDCPSQVRIDLRRHARRSGTPPLAQRARSRRPRPALVATRHRPMEGRNDVRQPATRPVWRISGTNPSFLVGTSSPEAALAGGSTHSPAASQFTSTHP